MEKKRGYRKRCKRNANIKDLAVRLIYVMIISFPLFNLHIYVCVRLDVADLNRIFIIFIYSFDGLCILAPFPVAPNVFIRTSYMLTYFYVNLV